MSYYCCLALPCEVNLRSAFASAVILEDFSNYPIGRALIGERKGWSAFSLRAGTDCYSLLGLGKGRNNQLMLFLDGLDKLQNSEIWSISFLFHLYRGAIAEETVVISNQVTMTLADFKSGFSKIEADVKYQIVLRKPR
jgi:hypothetical protein